MVKGMCVTRLVESEITLDNITCEWGSSNNSFDYDDERKKAFLLPQWGIYICAYSRKRILEAIANCGSDSLYTDTDSIKYIGNHSDYFEKVNKETRETMKQVCSLYGLDYSLFYDLGSFEKEYNGDTVSAKFLGAKRYIIKHNGNYEVTVAGLPKNSLKLLFDKLKIQYEVYQYGNYPLDIFEYFTNYMLLNSEVSLKNAHTYNDEPHTSIIDGVKCFEMSSVGIYPIDFTMKLSDFYVRLINQIQERDENYENRIY